MALLRPSTSTNTRALANVHQNANANQSIVIPVDMATNANANAVTAVTPILGAQAQLLPRSFVTPAVVAQPQPTVVPTAAVQAPVREAGQLEPEEVVQARPASEMREQVPAGAADAASAAEGAGAAGAARPKAGSVGKSSKSSQQLVTLPIPPIMSFQDEDETAVAPTVLGKPASTQPMAQENRNLPLEAPASAAATDAAVRPAVSSPATRPKSSARPRSTVDSKAKGMAVKGPKTSVVAKHASD